MSTAYTTHTHTARASVKERERETDTQRERERSIDFVFDKITKKISRFLCLHRIITQHSATLSTHTNTCTRTHHCMHVLPPQLLRSPHENCFCHTHRKGFTYLYSFFPLLIVVYFIANLFYVICTLSMSIKMINYCTRNINKYLKKLRLLLPTLLALRCCCGRCRRHNDTNKTGKSYGNVRCLHHEALMLRASPVAQRRRRVAVAKWADCGLRHCAKSFFAA